MTAPAWHSSFSRMKQRPHVLVVTPQAVGQTWIDAIEAAAAGRTQLWPWQAAGARYAAERPYAMLAMEMRTGKTLTALHAVGVADREVRPLLLNEGSTERRAATLRQALATESRPIVVVTNGDAVWRGELGEAIAGVSWAAIIIDESHQIKSPTGRKSKWLFALARKYPHAKRLCLTGTPLAHALAVDCPVLTPSGWRSMGTLRVGDLVVGSEGRPTKVVGVWPQGVKPMYRITFSDGDSIECTGDHLWSVTSRGRDSRGTGPLVLRTDELEKPRPAPRSKDKPGRGTRDSLMDAYGAPRWGVPIVKPVEFEPSVALPLDPYLLGAMLGDGTMGHNLAITSADDEIVEHVRRALPAGYSLTRKDNRVASRAADYRISSGKRGGSEKGPRRGPKKNPVTVAFEEMGLRGRDSATKFIPPAYLFASRENRLATLQGLCDTDGSVVDSCAVYTTISPHLAEGVRHLAQSLGGYVHTAIEQPRISRLPQGTTCLSSLKYKLTIRMPECPFRLSRKANKWVPCKRKPRRAIVSIEPVSPKEAQCITVDAADGLFVADRFIVTHNSPLDIFGQTRFLDPTVFGTSFPAFRARHMIPDRQFPARPASRWQLKSAGLATPWKNLDELTAKMDTFTYRVRRADVMACLPTTTDTIGVTLSPVTLRYYRQLEREMTAAVGDGTVTAANVLTKGIRLRQACGGRAVLDGTKCTVDIDGRAAKAAALKDWLEGLPDDEPVPVFCEFTDDLDAVAQVADELGRPYSEVSGRGKTLAEWQCGETTILGVQTRSGGLGVDLTRANLAVFYSLGWSLAEHEQALARLQGVNQKRPVGYYVLTAKGTIDEQVYSALAERRDVVEAVLGRLTGVKERGVA